MILMIDYARDLPDVRDVPIASLKIGRSPRLEGESEDHIQILAAAREELPPILVHAKTMQVIDGMHRLRAAQLNGASTIRVRFFNGSDEDAFIAAVESNTKHGLPLTLSEREIAARRILRYRPHQSDRWIAATAGVSAATVASIRQQVRSAAVSAEETARVGRDGKVRPLSSAAGRLAAQQAILENPQASLRDIAKISGISPGTVRDVRRRMANEESVVPRGETKYYRSVSTRDPESLGQTAVEGSDISEHSKEHPARFEAANIATVLSKLQKDPSIRHTEAGRNLLRSLDAYARVSERCVQQVNEVPPHCAYLLAEFAHRCAETWKSVEKQLKSSS
jgi:DNA-binding Lrp family transcriptional regulator